MVNQLKKLKLFGHGHFDQTFYFVLEKKIDFFSLFAKFLFSINHFHRSCSSFGDLLITHPSNFNDFDGKTLVFTISNIFEPVFTLSFFGDKIFLEFFGIEEKNQKELIKSLGFNLIDFDSLKENSVVVHHI